MSRMTITTTKCSKWNHPEFRLEFDSRVPPPDADVLASSLEQSVAAGRRYTDGQTIELGSMILRLVAVDGLFEVEEPDFIGFPISWQTGVSQSLRMLRLQKDTVESVGLGDELDFPPIRHSLLIGVDLAEGVESSVLARLKPEGLDSGWFVGRLDPGLDYNDSANLHRISVYQAILGWPHIAGFLALPTGSRVEISAERLEISRDGKRLEIQKRSFLDMAFPTKVRLR